MVLSKDFKVFPLFQQRYSWRTTTRTSRPGATSASKVCFPSPCCRKSKNEQRARSILSWVVQRAGIGPVSRSRRSRASQNSGRRGRRSSRDLVVGSGPRRVGNQMQSRTWRPPMRRRVRASHAGPVPTTASSTMDRVRRVHRKYLWSDLGERMSFAHYHYRGHGRSGVPRFPSHRRGGACADADCVRHALGIRRSS